MTSSFLKTTFWPAFTRISAGSNRKFFMLTVTAAASEELLLAELLLPAAELEEPPPPHAVTSRASTSSPASSPTGRHLEKLIAIPSPLLPANRRPLPRKEGRRTNR